MRIIFDTSFIITSVKGKIDFIHELEEHELVLPRQVVSELERLAEDKRKKAKERELAKVSLMLISDFRNRFKEIELEKKFVDRGLELLARKMGKEIVIATLDKGLRKKLKGKCKFLIIVKRKKLEIVN